MNKQLIKKRLLPIFVLACICVLSVGLVACNQNPADQKSADAFVTIDINPSIELTLDGDNRVLSVYAANEDAQILLYGEDGIVGADIDVAVEKITKLAVELGYLDENNKVIETSVTSTGDGADEILAKINTKITATAENFNMSVSCTGAEAYSLLRKLDNIKAQYPDNAYVQALTPEKLKVVISATETGEITFEAAVELDDEALIAMISDAHKEVEQFATKTYNEIKTKAFDAYDKAVGAAVDNVYAEYYLTNILKHPSTVYYGITYQAYKTGARGLNAVADALSFVENVCDTPLDKEQIAAISAALGLGEDVSALENSDGEITVKSVEAYADKLFKNSQTSAQIEAVKAELTTVLNKTETMIQETINEKAKEYESQITAVTDAFETAKNYLITITNPMIKEQIEIAIADFNEILASVETMMKDGKITSDEVRGISTLLNEKSNNALEKIKSDLSDDELDAIENEISQRQEKLSSVKAEMENTVAQAEQAAKDYLAQRKAQLKQN